MAGSTDYDTIGVGYAERRRPDPRIAPRRVLLAFDEPKSAAFWLAAEYFPETAAIESARAPQIDHVVDGLAATRVEVVPIPRDCTDGFAGAYWRRPDAYLDPRVRSGISSLAAMDADALSPGLTRLRSDLESGVWHERHADLLARDEIDLGYRLVITD